MHELIYRFLLEAGYSRASLISLVEPLSPLPEGLYASAIQASPAPEEPTPESIDSTEKYRRFFRKRAQDSVPESSLLKPGQENEPRSASPTYLVVDPETTELLSVIGLVEGESTEELTRHQREANHYAEHAGDKHTQVYLIQLRSGGESTSERIHFYHAGSTEQLHPVSAYAFPDLDTLRAHRIHFQAIERHQAVEEVVEPPRQEEPSGPGRVYFLAVLLLLMALADGWQQFHHGTGLFSVSQVLLVISACLLIAAPVLSLRHRRSSKRT